MRSVLVNTVLVFPTALRLHWRTDYWSAGSRVSSSCKFQMIDCGSHVLSYEFLLQYSFKTLSSWIQIPCDLVIEIPINKSLCTVVWFYDLCCISGNLSIEPGDEVRSLGWGGDGVECYSKRLSSNSRIQIIWLPFSKPCAGSLGLWF